jgi:hypothetical protein
MFHDLTGQRFFRITITARRATDAITALPTWHARCVCGRYHIAATSPIVPRCIVPVHCPCSIRKPRKRRPGEQHGMSTSREYAEWRALRKRCATPAAARKKLSLFPAWEHSFGDFLAEVGRCPSPNAKLSRVDRRQPWVPGNTRWIVTSQPRRRIDARMLTLDGKTASLSNWARSAGMKPQTLHARLARGMALRDALLQPLRARSTVESAA